MPSASVTAATTAAIIATTSPTAKAPVGEPQERAAIETQESGIFWIGSDGDYITNQEVGLILSVALLGSLFLGIFYTTLNKFAKGV